MQLCALLKIPSRRILKRTLSHREMQDWVDLWRCDPWGEDRGDLRAGKIACASLAPWAKTQPRPIDFMPYVVDTDQKKADAEAHEESMKKTAAIVAERFAAARERMENGEK